MKGKRGGVSRWRAITALLLTCLYSSLATLSSAVAAGKGVDWPTYGGSPAGERYSPLTQINRQTVGRLKMAWRFETGPGNLQASPLVVGSRLFSVTPSQSVIALDAATGELLWEFTPEVRGAQPIRGVSYWSDGREARILVGIMGDLWALDAATGKPVLTFGDGGRANLRRGFATAPEETPVFMTTPGVIYRDLIVVGFRTSETLPAAAGSIRAFDVRTGSLKWTFNTIPRPGEFGHDTWPAEGWKAAGAANAWAGMVVDEVRGILYAPTGSAAADFFGADRHGDNLFANSLLALDINTGRRLWHFQTTHHDIWDRDLPSPPVLLSVTHRGRRIDAVAQTSKQGFLFLFDRVTGKPLFPIREMQFPGSDIAGEKTAPTQPVVTKPAPFARQRLTADMLTRRSPEIHAAALKAFATFRSDGQYIPFGLDRPVVVFPGFDGGAEWGGPAVNPTKGVIYVNANDVPWLGALRRASPGSGAASGAGLYERNCSGCHGADRKGAPPEFPGLANVGSQLTSPELSSVIANGRGRMPGFPQLRAAEMEALVAFLRSGGTASRPSTGGEPGPDAPAYVFSGYRKFLDLDGYPAVKPPWGTLNAIDLNTGKYLWKIPLGEYPELVARGEGVTGSENYGGPIVTAGDIVLIAATIYDRKMRAFDARSGALLWESVLPYAGVATPATYMSGGRQYVVVATSGGRDRKGPQGSAYVAFAIPE